MAIPSTPTNFYLQTANAQNYLSWDISVGATTYNVQRSLDGVTYASVSTPAINNYTDTSVSSGVQYFYKVASVNGSGTSPYTSPQSCVPAPTGELSLQSLRLASQQKADRVNSNFVTLPEWNFFISLAMTELYDLLITSYEDYFMAAPARFLSDGTTYLYPLPNGVVNFINPITNVSAAAQPFYKLLGVDLGINNANNANVTVDKFNFIDRNKFIYPNSSGTMYGVFNMRYRVMGNNIEIIPTPSANQPITLWYIPRLPQMMKDTDITTIGYSGWLQYVIVRAAKYALDKEESDTTKLDAELIFLKQRIEESSINRDAGRPDTISDSRGSGPWGGNGFGWNGSIGGF